MMDKTNASLLVADDDPRILQLLKVFLERSGFRVLTASNGNDAVVLAQEVVPDLVLVDVMMPQMDGYEVCRQLRNDTRTSHLPILMLTSRSAVRDKITGFESGADDYVTKPFDLDELLARVRSLLRRATEVPVRSPLTGLAGNRLLQEELKHRLHRPEPMALAYVDLDNFKAFNDAYGFFRGDQAIQLLARLIEDVVEQEGTEGDFIGHIGGDDFAIITVPQRVEAISELLIERFDAEIQELYDPQDRERGYLRGYDRYGVPHRFPVMTISIGTVTNRNRSFADLDDLSRTAAEMKTYAKGLPGSSYAVDQREDKQIVAEPQERRGRPPIFEVAVVGGESDLVQLLQLYLEKSGHDVRLYPSGRQLLELSGEQVPHLIILDAVQRDIPVWDLCQDIRQEPVLKYCPLLLVSTDSEDEERAFQRHIDAFLLKPFSRHQFSACVQGLLERRSNRVVEQAGVEDEQGAGR
ncbi:MAG: response regulator [Chloroflexia bacterium]|nr:response regulator [Chloroflexia bacterium]